MTTMQTIDSRDISLDELFNDFYVVPSYQREYIWGTPQVERLLQDIYTEFSSTEREADSEYFIGSTVVCNSQEGTFELIDGQQRMTTAFLVLCAIRDHLSEIGASPIESLQNRIAASNVDNRGNDVYRYRVALQYEDSHDILETIAKEKNPDLDSVRESTRSIANILNAYRVIRSFLQSEFAGDEKAVRAFYAYFTKSVKLIRVKTISVAHALKVFETINDRGVGLNSMDLLKNLLFMHTERKQFNQLKNVWKELVDVLYRANEKPLRFLRYFIFSTYSVDRLREDQIYGWFVSNEPLCGFKTEPVRFASELLEAAKSYASFIRGQDPNGKSNRFLTNISYLSGSARQHLILLLAGRKLPSDLFDELCKHIENLFFAYTIAREPTREFERNFAVWAPEVRKVRDQDDLNAFIDSRIRPAKENLSQRFSLALEELGEKSIQKYRLRYILAKICQYINEKAWGSATPNDNLRTFLNNKVDVEHILPQKPSKAVKDAFDKPDAIEYYIRRLGNLTLLEKPIDASIGNGLYQKKQPAYRQSNFLVTKSLVEDVSIGVNTTVDRAVKDLLTFEEWTSNSIEQRQAMLAGLAHKVWDMPEIRSQVS